uniref:Cytochrome b n=1 Tax=Vallicula multiformis TaxID=140489 RepID=A0A2R4ZKL2_9METZ|nr:cytochrome b [Vallicula multiformis]
MPTNLNYSFNFGILLIFVWLIQILSGVFLVFYFNLSSNIFFSLNFLFNDVFFGNFLRYLHCIGANLFFIIIFLHIFKSYFYSNFRVRFVSLSGSIIFFLLCGIAFLGYVLPWGQMSFWGATVITNLLSIFPLSNIFLFYIWGDYSVSFVTMLRFFSLHYLLPFILGVFIFFHLNLLHLFGSSSSSLVFTIDLITFFPVYVFIDVFAVLVFFFFLAYFLFFKNFFFFESENFLFANNLVTPNHIKPEWYFLFPYAILRVFTSKSLGVIFLVLSIFSFFIISFYDYFFNNFFIFIVIFIFFFFLFTYLGGQIVAFPFNFLSENLTFFFFLIILFFFFFNYLKNFYSY